MDDIEIYSYSIKYRMTFPFSPQVPNFSFDCRGVSNPGRVHGLMELTGLDSDVITYLDGDKNASQFLNQADELLVDHFSRVHDKAYGRFIVGFGCTGGRHRSVYFAERVTAVLRRRFLARVVTVSHLDIAAKYVPSSSSFE